MTAISSAISNSHAMQFAQKNDLRDLDNARKIEFKDGSSLEVSNDGDTATLNFANGESITLELRDDGKVKAEVKLNNVADGSKTEEAIEAGIEELLSNQAIDQAGEDYGSGGKAKGKAKGGSWWMALFAKLGEQLNGEAAKLEGMLDGVAGGQDKPGDLLLASAQMQRLGFMMSQDGAIVSSFGSGAKGLADGAK